MTLFNFENVNLSISGVSFLIFSILRIDLTIFFLFLPLIDFDRKIRHETPLPVEWIRNAFGQWGSRSTAN